MLAAASSADTVYLTWEWLDAWLAAVGRGEALRVVTVRDGAGVLVGALPLYLTSFRLGKVVSYRCLRFMGDTCSGAEYPDVIARKGYEDSVCKAVAGALRQMRGWDCLWIPRVAGWTGGVDRVKRVCELGGLVHAVRPAEFSAFRLPGSVDAYFDGLSANRRSQVRRDLKRAGREGLELVRCADPSDLPVFLDALFDLHHRRRSRLGDPGTFRRKPREAAFYRVFARTALDRGWLRLYGLKKGDAFEAIQIGYAYNGVYHQLQEGFDPEGPPGMGNALRFRVVEACIREGLREYDFLGGFTDHKRRWGAQKRSGAHVFAGRNTLKNRLLFGPGVWPTGRYVDFAPVE